MRDRPQDITFNRPVIAGREMEYIREAVERMHTSGDGTFTRRCCELLQRELDVPRVLLTPSCTDALEMAALLLDLEPGDEVIVPSFAFVSVANAVALRRARPVFADIRPDTLNLDETQLESRITERTRAIVALHYAGVACEMDALVELCRRRGLALIEDNAHGLFARYRGKPLGTFGTFATQSFHETKNLACGEGGALLVNDPERVERAEVIRDKGTNRQALFRGQVDKYTWVDLGSSFVLSDLLAAYLYGQLEARESIARQRSEIWRRYDEGLREPLSRQGVLTPTVPAECESSHHTYFLILESLERRQALIAWLGERGILSVFHYTPLHLSEMGRSLGGRPGDCPVTERISDCQIRLPFYNDLAESDQRRVIDEVLRFFDA